MGEVWLADQDAPVRRRVAVKLIKSGIQSREVVARFDAERQALAIMNHPNIASVFDAGTTSDGRPYFAMEFVPGEPITKYCDRHRLTIKDRLELFSKVCGAVQHAHQKGVIHRDLKPGNILVMIQDDRPVPKVIDFGIAKALERRLSDTTYVTELGCLIGTPEYMSPEQAEMSPLDIDTRSDVYSLGVLLYELLTGGLPFNPGALRAAGVSAMQRFIREYDPPRPSARITLMQQETSGTAVAATESWNLGSPDTRNDQTVTDVKRQSLSPAPQVTDTWEITRGGVDPIPDATSKTELPDLNEVVRLRNTTVRSLVSALRVDLDWIVMKCLEKDRTRRYDSAGALIDDVERYQKGEPILAGPPSNVYRLRKFARRHRVAAVVSIVVFLSLMVAGWGLVRGARIARVQRDRALAAQSEAEFQSRKSGAFNDMLNTLFDSRKGRDIAIGEVADQLAGQLTEAGQAGELPEPEVEACVRLQIGRFYFAIGRHQESKKQLERAREILNSGKNDSRHALAEALDFLGRNEYYLSSSIDKARNLILQASKLKDQTPESEANLRVMNGALDFEQDQYESAASQFDTAMLLCRDSLETSSVYWDALHDQGYLLQALGGHETAEAIYRYVIAHDLAWGAPDDCAMAEAYNNLGVALVFNGLTEEGSSWIDRAATIRERCKGRDTLAYANSVITRGHVELFTQNFDNARVYYESALEIQKRVANENKLAAGFTLTCISTAQALLGRDRDSEQTWSSYLTGCLNRGAKPPRLAWYVRWYLPAQVAFVNGDWEHAEKRFETAISHLATDRPDTLSEHAVCRLRISEIRAAKGALVEASEIALKASWELRDRLGALHPLYAAALIRSAMFNLRAGQLDVAVSQLREVRRIYESSLPAGVWLVDRAAALYQISLRDSGSPDYQQSELERAMKTVAESLPGNDRRYLELRSLANAAPSTP